MNRAGIKEVMSIIEAVIGSDQDIMSSDGDAQGVTTRKAEDFE